MGGLATCVNYHFDSGGASSRPLRWVAEIF